MHSGSFFLIKHNNRCPNRHRLALVDLTDRLLEEKILVKRSDRPLFQHDLIRAYLASLYLLRELKSLPIAAGLSFASKWKSLLSKPTLKIDANWGTMLEFTILEVGNAKTTRELLLAILSKNRQVAADLFKWLRDSHPDLVAGWAEDFTRAYGKASLE
jgi:hypothetical protein